MNNEYIIVNKTTIQKRIEELEKELAYHNEWYEKAREKYHQDRKSWGNADDGEMRVASDAAFTTAQEVKILKQILSQSTPLIPEIEKAYNTGTNYGCYLQGGSYDHNDNIDIEDYISILKLDV